MGKLGENVAVIAALIPGRSSKAIASIARRIGTALKLALLRSRTCPGAIDSTAALFAELGDFELQRFFGIF